VQMTRRLSKTEKAVMNEAREFGADDGMVVPIITKSGIGLFSACGRLPNLSPRARAALEIVAIYSHQALSRASNREGRQRQQTNTPLTQREREIMTWVATGKSDDEIADILSISRETVTTHVENAKRKLGAARRTYAIVQALRLGEIAL
jgi:LuxR family transcriptional regulator, quorum-sensing system regulator BjaR1